MAQQAVEPQMTAVAYFYTYKLNTADVQPRQENMNLLIDGNESSFQAYNLRKMDTINAQNTSPEINDPVLLEARKKYPSFHKYNIHINGSEVTFTSTIGVDQYNYKEELNLDWQLKDGSMEILGYACKEATVDYAGRLWTAWYAPDLPFNAGPYKFKGLPGLILKVTDRTGDFDFEAKLMGSKKKAPLAYGFHSKSKQLIETTRKEFNNINASYESLSFNEKMNFGRSDGSKIVITQMWDNDGNEQSLRQLDQAPKDERLYLEIDHKDQ